MVMRYNYARFSSPQFRVLSDDQLEELHLATIQIMERTGVTFQCQEAIELLGNAGADVSNPNRVKIPSSLVEQALRTAPKSITLYTRDGEPAIVLNGMTGSHFGSAPDPRVIMDPYTRKPRTCYVEDIVDRSRVIDALANIEWTYTGAANNTLPTFAGLDISDRVTLLQFILNSSKPIVCEITNVEALRDMIDLCSIVAGGEEQLRRKPFFGGSCEPVTPLVEGKDAVEKSLLCAEKGIPVVVYSMPMAGATTPATFAGCLAIANAEFLSQLVALQLKNPGAPVIYGSIPNIMEMRTTIFPYGAPEMSLMVAALTGLSHYYKLPMFGTAGCTDAYIIGAQAGAEITYQILLTMLSGADLVHDVGILYHSAIGSPEIDVFVDEIIDMVKVTMGGIDINEETIPLDLIDRVGPGGNYISEKHTLKHFRKFWVPRIFDRSAIRVEGAKDCEDLLRERTINLMETHQPKPLPEDMVKELKKVEASWLKRIGLKEYPKRK
jgi:trimethylamine--corrinoid protein Co-methyltransferase